MVSRAPAAQDAPARVEPLHFHHMHLNSTDPKAAAAWPAGSCPVSAVRTISYLTCTRSRASKTCAGTRRPCRRKRANDHALVAVTFHHDGGGDLAEGGVAHQLGDGPTDDARDGEKVGLGSIRKPVIGLALVVALILLAIFVLMFAIYLSNHPAIVNNGYTRAMALDAAQGTHRPRRDRRGGRPARGAGCAACPRPAAARTGSASRSPSASSCRRWRRRPARPSRARAR